METHITVLKKEAVDALNLRSDSIAVDATLGAGGHSKAMLAALGKDGTLIALDADPAAIAAGKAELEAHEVAVHLVTANFRDIDTVLDRLGVKWADAILADLGWRIEQFAGGGKGFSFQVDEPLLMTFGDPATYPFTARDIVNDWSEESIKNVLRGYGEERFAGRIARNIVEARQTDPIETSGGLREIVLRAVPAFYRRGKIHPATRTFQALRIAVNDELGALEDFIQKSAARLAPQGRLAVITFHSIEDRIVKRAFRMLEQEGAGTVCTKKPIAPNEEELQDNPRARSAKLRVFEHAL